MLQLIKSKLSLKVSIVLAAVSLPPMILAAYFITANEGAEVERMTINQGKAAATMGARMYASALEAGVEAGFFSLKDLMEPTYEEIKGYDWGNIPRFHTAYDAYCDRVLTPVQDKILESSTDFFYALGNDVNGYAPSQVSRFELAITGDPAKDLAGYRAKRKFGQDVHIAASHNTAPIFVQAYLRDTGDQIWDVSAPVYVKGQHWGTFRVGVARTSIAAHRRTIVIQLSVVFGLLAVMSISVMFFMLRRSMRPLEELAQLAGSISTGEGLDKQIKPSTTDEIGQMAKALNRLRASLASAISRIDGGVP